MRRVAIFCSIVTLCLYPLLGWGQMPGDDNYNAFNQFCLENFGAEKDQLYYDHFGQFLAFVPGGEWEYFSENSATIAFESNLPANAWVEYGTTNQYGNSTGIGERPFFIHVRHLTGLQAGTQYHYRLVIEDERGNQVASGDRVFQTRSPGGVVYLPGDVAGPPYVLDQANSTYVITQDLEVPQRAFTISASGVILDFNGHIVSYDNGSPCVAEGSSWDQFLNSDCSSFGIKVNSGVTSTIVNGTIRQGGSHKGDPDIGYGFNPILVHSGGSGNNIIAGMVIEWNGDYLSGLTTRSGTGEYHHNILVDKGTLVGNRQQGRKAIMCGDWGQYTIHHNLIKRCRQQGIVLPVDVHDNEIYIDSYSTNSYGIKPHADQTVRRNRVFGTGYHAVAFGWGLQDYCDSLVYRNNFAHLQGVEPTDRDSEYGITSGVVGFRLTQYNGSTRHYKNYLYEGNTVIVKARLGTTDARGVQITSDDWVENCVFRDNVVKTEVQDNTTTRVACIVGHGQQDDWDAALPVLYEGNTFYSNQAIIRFGDSYQSGGRHQFKNCRLIRIGTRLDFRTVQIGYWSFDSFDNLFVDCIEESGADLDDPFFDGTPGGDRDYSVGHSLHLIAQDSNNQVLANVPLEVQDSTGQTYSIMTDSSGHARVEFLETTYSAPAGLSGYTTLNRGEHSLNISGFLPVQVGSDLFNIRDNENSPVPVIFSQSGDEPTPGPPINARFQ